jgi:hypothetical protein
MVSDDPEKLANDFARFFADKIERVKDKLDNLPSRSHPAQPFRSPPQNSQFSGYAKMSEDSIKKIIMKSSSSSCPLDCIPTWLLKASVN